MEEEEKEEVEKEEEEEEKDEEEEVQEEEEKKEEMKKQSLTSLEGVKFRKSPPKTISKVEEKEAEELSEQNLIKALEGMSLKKSTKKKSPSPTPTPTKKQSSEEISPRTKALLETVLVRKPKKQIPKEETKKEETKKEEVPEKLFTKKEEEEEVDIPLIRRKPVRVIKEEPAVMITKIKPEEPLLVKKKMTTENIVETDQGPEKRIKEKVATQVIEKPSPAQKPPSRQPSLAKETVDIKSILEQVEQDKISTARGAKYYTSDQMKDILRSIGKATYGSKAELVERLQNLLKQYNLM